MIQFVWDQNAFYEKRFKHAGISPSDIQSIDDVSRLPILSKADIRDGMHDIISRGYDIRSLQEAKTGGSTGKSLQLYFTEECSELRNACALRHDRWTGWKPGEPIAACWGNPHLPKTWKEKVKHWALQPMIYLDTMSVNDESVKTFAREWKRMQPTLLYGHAHSIYILATYLNKMGIDDLKPRGILSTSMMLMPSERKIIENQFGTKVIDRYGCEEVSLIGCECERHEGLHLNIEHLYIEFVKDNGESAKPGELGNIVVTDLMNKAMPLIRYKVEDMGIPSDKKCSCGRGLPLMNHVAGRVADFLIKHDGTKVAGISLIENTLTKFEGIRQMQIVQNDIEHILLNLVVDALYTEKIEKELISYFKTLFLDVVQLEIKKKETIDPEPSGKYRFSICRIREN